MSEGDAPDDQGRGGSGEDADDLAVAGEGEASPGPCRYCGEALPAAAAGGPGRRREYHRKGESRDGRDCKEAARRARASTVGATTERPLQALTAWSTTEETARRAHAQELRVAADRDLTLADQLADLRVTVLDRNTELEEQAAQDHAELTEAQARADAAERRERRTAEDTRTAIAEARADADSARDRADAADKAAALHQTAREQAERETGLVEQNRDELRDQLTTARRELTATGEQLTAVHRQHETIRADRDARAAQLEQTTAQLAEAQQKLTETTAALHHATAQAERAEQTLAAEQRTAAERIHTAEQATTTALAAAQTSRNERDQAHTDLVTAKAGHNAERTALERERDTARADADNQRERAARAEHALTQAETRAQPQTPGSPPEHRT
ncbi:MAG TPA: hypothetical protein VGD53_12445 [Actinoallomurus sp.]|jgi:chromosome segregation ATPase